MKRLMKSALIAVTAAMIATAGVSAVYANDGTGISVMNVTVSEYKQDMAVIPEHVNVRTAPDINSRVLHTLPKGTVVHVDGKVSNGWYRIWTTDPVYGGETAGYIYEKLLSTATAKK